MRYRMPVLAAGALAAALAFGTSTATHADPAPKLNLFEVVDSTPVDVTLLADAPPELAGQNATILFGANPFDGFPVAGAKLKPGVNLIQAQNCGPGWFTAIGPFKAVAAKIDSSFGDYPTEE